MKTANDILSGYTQAYVNDPRALFEWKDVVGAMHEYATEKVKEALKLAAERATIKTIKVLKKNHVLNSHFANGIRFEKQVVDKQSILSLESELVNNINKDK